MEHGFQQAVTTGSSCGELSLQLVAEGHRLVDLGDDPVLFGLSHAKAQRCQGRSGGYCETDQGYERNRIFRPLLRASSETAAVSLTPKLFESAFDLYRRHTEKQSGPVDCVSFVVMQRMGLRTALAFDEHFVQAAFVLPRLWYGRVRKGCWDVPV